LKPFGKILWLSPTSLAGINPIAIWGEYLKERNTWEITTDPSEGVDVIFFGSESVLSDELLKSDAFKICYFWDFMPRRFLSQDFRKWAQSRLNLMARCNMVLVPSMVTMDQANLLGLNVTICTPGIDNKLIDSIEDQKEEFQICAVGRLTAHKQHEWIIHAVSLLNPQPKLVIIGAGDTKPLEQFAERLDVDCRIGPLSDEDKIKEIKKSACLVTASSFEGFGMAGIEALYCGTPVLAFDTPIHREMLKDNAIYFSSIDDLARKLVAVLSDRDLRNKLSERGREYVANNLTFEKATDRLEQVLNHVIKQILGKKARARPSKKEWIDIYDSEAKRSLRYHPYRADPHWSRYWEPRHYVKLLKEYGIKHVLDVGAGAVHPTIYALEGIDVSVCECSKVAIKQGKEIAAKHGVDKKIEWEHGFAEKLPFENNTFDAVIQSHIWEHVTEPERLIEEGLRVLKPGGILIGAVPLEHHHYDPLHLHIFTVDDIKKLLSRFSDVSNIIEVTTIAEPTTEPSVILSILEKKP